MRIAHLCETFSLLSETFIYDSVTELERQGLDNHVLAFQRVNVEDRPFDKVHVANTPWWGHPRRLWHRALAEIGIGEKDWSAWPILRSRVKRKLQYIDPGVIQAHFGPAGLLAVPVARALNVPLVVTFYGYDVTSLAQEARWRQAYQALFDQAVVLIGVSNHICKRIIELGASASKVKQLHLSTRIGAFDFQERSDTVRADPVQCLHVGRLVEKKAPVLLVEAFHCAHERLKGSGPALHLNIVGEGALRGDVERRIDDLGLDEKVEVLGGVSHKHIAKLMGDADIYTQHSITASNGDQEGLPVSLIEATATGLPVVSTRHSGIPDLVVQGKTGLLVEERDVEGMGRCIAELATDPARRRAMGRAGRRRVEEHFDLEKQMRKMSSLYESVLPAKV